MPLGAWRRPALIPGLPKDSMRSAVAVAMPLTGDGSSACERSQRRNVASSSQAAPEAAVDRPAPSGRVTARHVMRPSSVTRCTSTCPRSSRSCRAASGRSARRPLAPRPRARAKQVVPHVAAHAVAVSHRVLARAQNRPCRTWRRTPCVTPVTARVTEHGPAQEPAHRPRTCTQPPPPAAGPPRLRCRSALSRSHLTPLPRRFFAVRVSRVAATGAGDGRGGCRGVDTQRCAGK